MKHFSFLKTCISILAIIILAGEFSTVSAATATPPSINISDGKTFDSILEYFQSASEAGFQNLLPYAKYLLFVFGVINIGTTWMLYDGSMRMSELIGRIIKIGAFTVLVYNMGVITTAILESFQMAGATASGDTSALTSIAHAFSPSDMIDKGMEASGHLIDAEMKRSGIHPLDFLTVVLAAGLAIVGTLFIAIQLLLTLVEFHLFAAVGVILLPFGLFRPTGFLCQRAIGAVFSYGVKTMVLFFMIGLANILTKQFAENISKVPTKLTEHLDFTYLINFGLAYFVLGYLVWKIPNIVQGMMSGTPSLDGAGAARSVMSGSVGAVTGGAMKATGAYGAFKATQAAAQDAMLAKNGIGVSATAAAANANAGMATPAGGGSGGGSTMDASTAGGGTGGTAQAAGGGSSGGTGANTGNSYLDRLAEKRAAQAAKRSGTSGQPNAIRNGEQQNQNGQNQQTTANRPTVTGTAKSTSTWGTQSGHIGTAKEFVKIAAKSVVANIPLVNAARAAANRVMARNQNFDKMFNDHTWYTNMEPLRNDYRSEVDRSN